jgi:predicted ATPase
MAQVSNKIKLKKITLNGFKSFDNSDHKIKFSDVTVLIGANGVGKSNLVSFFKMIGYMMTNALQQYIGDQGGASSILHFGPKISPRLTATLEFGNESSHDSYEFSLAHAAKDSVIITEETLTYHEKTIPNPFRITLSPGIKESGLPEEILKQENNAVQQVIYNLLRNCRVYQFHDTSSTSKIRNSGYINDSDYLRSDAGNLAAFLYSMQQVEETKNYYERIVRHISNVMPQFGDFVLRSSARNKEYILLDWKEKNSDYLFGPHQVSDGTLRFMALATLLLQPPKKLPPVIILDEPELGLHPSAISELAGMIRTASRYCQVIIATQSPRLLDEFELNEIVVIERENKTSVFRDFNEQQLENWLKDYSLSELWEKNVIGGQP